MGCFSMYPAKVSPVRTCASGSSNYNQEGTTTPATLAAVQRLLFPSDLAEGGAESKWAMKK